MNIIARIKTLQWATRRVASSRSSQQATMLRLATRWLRAGLERDMDILLRLQVLEGAAGVPVDTWMKKQKRGMAEAQTFFEGQPLDPSWFISTNTGMYDIIFSLVQSTINKLKLRRVDPLDVISGYLMGLGVNITGPGVKRPAYAAGTKLADGILSGTETPVRVAKGTLGRYFINKVWPEQRKQKDVSMPVDDDGAAFDVADTTQDLNLDPGQINYGHDAFGEFLAEIVFKDLHDPLGVKIRDLMRATWHSSPPMLIWLDTVENEHRFPTKRETAEKAGMTPGAFGASHWIPRWKKFLAELKTRRNIQDDLADRAREEGIAWSPEQVTELDPDDLMTTKTYRMKPRSAAQDLALLFLSRTL